jgi:hypothetical protein
MIRLVDGPCSNHKASCAEHILLIGISADCIPQLQLYNAEWLLWSDGYELERQEECGLSYVCIWLTVSYLLLRILKEDTQASCHFKNFKNKL